MFDYQTMKLMHRHGEDEWLPMTEEPHHSQAQHDPERSLLRRRVFRCSRCEEFVAVSAEPAGSAEAAQGEAGGR